MIITTYLGCHNSFWSFTAMTLRHRGWYDDNGTDSHVTPFASNLDDKNPFHGVDFVANYFLVKDIQMETLLLEGKSKNGLYWVHIWQLLFKKKLSPLLLLCKALELLFLSDTLGLAMLQMLSFNL